MTGTRIRTAAVIAVPLLMASQCAASAGAVAPPPIDDTMLPAPAPPAPPQPTRQHETCSDNSPTHLSYQRGAGENLADREAIWRLTRGSGQRVAVIDTGVEPNPRLTDVVAGGDYVSDGDGRKDCDGHGTVVASIIGASIIGAPIIGAPSDAADTAALSGLAPDATLISIRQSSTKFSPVSGHRGGVGDVRTLAMAVRTAADMGASVINISSVACSASPPDDGSLGAALSYAVDIKDAVIVTAAGNVGGAGQCPEQNTSAQPIVVASPAWYDDYVIAVGSVSPDGAPSPFSLRGPWVDVAAPGEQVIALTTKSGPTRPVPISGTSYAAPVVSAAAALVRSRFPRLSARQVMSRLEHTAHAPAGRDDLAVGAGVVDILAAVSDEITHTATDPADPKPVVRQSSENSSSRIALVGATVCLTCTAVAAAVFHLRRRSQRAATEDVDSE